MFSWLSFFCDLLLKEISSSVKSINPRTAVKPKEWPAPSVLSLNKPRIGISFSSFTVRDLLCQSTKLWAISLKPTPPTGLCKLGKISLSIESFVSRKFGSKNSPPE